MEQELQKKRKRERKEQEREELAEKQAELAEKQAELAEKRFEASAVGLGRQTKILQMKCEQFVENHPKLDPVSLRSHSCPHCGNKVNPGYATCGKCNNSDLVWPSVDLKYCRNKTFTAGGAGCDFREKQLFGPCIKSTEGIHIKYLNLLADAENKNREWKLKLLAEKSCFVATACFGDEQHPTVLGLRRFRDQVLQKKSLGRSFIAWYYRNGPGLANTLDYIPWIYPLLRANAFPWT